MKGDATRNGYDKVHEELAQVVLVNGTITETKPMNQMKRFPKSEDKLPHDTIGTAGVSSESSSITLDSAINNTNGKNGNYVLPRSNDAADEVTHNQIDESESTSTQSRKTGPKDYFVVS